MNGTAGRRVFVALDTDDLSWARRLIGGLSGHVFGFKIGLQLFSSHGNAAVGAVVDNRFAVKNAARPAIQDAAVFLAALGRPNLVIDAGMVVDMLFAASEIQAV